MCMRSLDFAAAALVASITLLFGCGKSPATEQSVNTPADTVIHLTELPAPVPPAYMSEPRERAAYMVRHFWDALPELSDEQAADTILIEQTFSNFINLLGYVDADSVAQAIEILIDKSSGNAGTLRLIDFLAWKYLDEPNSPMRSEEMYIFFLRRLSGGEGVPEEIALRSAERLKSALKNRPGSFAADIPLLSRDGGRTSLHALAAADTVLVVFYDPDCEHCRETTDRLAASEIPYPILAIDVIPDRQLWDDTKNSLPAHWHVAFATTAVEDRELYTFPALPSLYLLAPGARVILKDFTP